jgi:CDGSH-type Zn-finger protein
MEMEEERIKKPGTLVEVMDSGPLKITGNVILKDLQRDTEGPYEELLLCRCGDSKRKPFCDNSHNCE